MTAAPTRPRPHGVRQWRRLVQGRALDAAMRAPLALQPRRLRRRMHWSVRIGLATSVDTRTWRWDGVVLREPFHLSYPCVFTHGGHLYMIPESTAAGAVRLYGAVSGPRSWRHERDLVTGPSLNDATPLHHEGHWYLFVETSTAVAHDELRLFHARDLGGPWSEHRCSPIVTDDPAVSRPAGHVWCLDGRTFRLAQDCTTAYRTAVVAREIIRLTPSAYVETAVAAPLLTAGAAGWRRNGMHHVDTHELPCGDWLVAADGW